MGEEGPGQGDQLALAGRERLAPLVDHGVEPVGQALHQLGQAHPVAPPPRSRLVGRLGPGERDVVPDGAGEEEGLLGDDAELAAQRPRVTPRRSWPSMSTRPGVGS